MRIRSLIFLLMLMALAASAFAHHSFTGYYSLDRPVSVTGTIVKVDSTNLAAFVHLRVEDKATGKITIWAFEAEAFRILERAFKLSKDMFKEGSRITIVGYGQNDSSRDVSETVTDNPEVAARVKAETQAAIAQVEFADGKKIAIMKDVPEIPTK